MTRKHSIYIILADKKEPYLSYHSWQGGTLFFIYVTIRYTILYIAVDGSDPIYDIPGEKKGPYLLYQNWQGGTLYIIS